MADPVRYRVGRSLGRTVYDGDQIIGMMDTPDLGQKVVAALNASAPDMAARELAEYYRHRHEMTPSERQSYLGETAEQSAEPERSAYASAAAHVAENLTDVTGFTWTREAAVDLGIELESAIALVNRLREHIELYGRPLSRSAIRALTDQGGQQ